MEGAGAMVPMMGCCLGLQDLFLGLSGEAGKVSGVWREVTEQGGDRGSLPNGNRKMAVAALKKLGGANESGAPAPLSLRSTSSSPHPRRSLRKQKPTSTVG